MTMTAAAWAEGRRAIGLAIFVLAIVVAAAGWHVFEQPIPPARLLATGTKPPDKEDDYEHDQARPEDD